jgi:hypothetical protein
MKEPNDPTDPKYFSDALMIMLQSMANKYGINYDERRIRTKIIEIHTLVERDAEGGPTSFLETFTAFQIYNLYLRDQMDCGMENAKRGAGKECEA